MHAYSNWDQFVYDSFNYIIERKNLKKKKGNLIIVVLLCKVNEYHQASPQKEQKKSYSWV